MVRRIGGGILIAVSVAVPVIVDKMDVHLTAAQGIALLVVCGIVGLVGLIMALWPERRHDANSVINQSVTSHGQTGGITARNVTSRDE
jgi:hypothetical protein